MKDVSQSTNRVEIILEIARLNPEADISLGNPYLVTRYGGLFYSSITADKLKLPEGFYYSEKNGITNKHNTKSGAYTTLSAAPIPKDQDIRFLPKVFRDVKNSTNRGEVVLAIQELNPYIDMCLGDPHYVSSSADFFYSSMPDEYLILPDGFYYNRKNGITNKHNTESGAYISLKTKDIPRNINENRDVRLLPKEVEDVRETNNIRKVVEAIQELNPYAEVRLGNIEFDPRATTRFFASVPPESLLLPQGFYYNEKNGITNKHNTKTGMYASFEVESLRDVDERTLMPENKKIIRTRVPSNKSEENKIKEAILTAFKNLKVKSKFVEEDNVKSR